MSATDPSKASGAAAAESDASILDGRRMMLKTTSAAAADLALSGTAIEAIPIPKPAIICTAGRPQRQQHTAHTAAVVCGQHRPLTIAMKQVMTSFPETPAASIR